MKKLYSLFSSFPKPTLVNHLWIHHGLSAYLWLLKTVEPAKVSTNFYVNPVIAVFMGWLVADETVTLPMIFATIVILAGEAVINTKLPPIGQRRRQNIKLNMEGVSTE
ncbi:MAG: hypothetical protein DPW16_15420 [Chloroflexi bacterium]|nr:hypothetical protein [Chloroflexota bacterium]